LRNLCICTSATPCIRVAAMESKMQNMLARVSTTSNNVSNKQSNPPLKIQSGVSENCRKSG
jgi:hypothetical protein